MEIWIPFITLLTSASVSPIRTFKRDTGGVTLASTPRITARIVGDNPVNYYRKFLHFPLSSKYIAGEIELILFHHESIATINNTSRVPIFRHAIQRKINVLSQDRNICHLTTPNPRAGPVHDIPEAVTGRNTTSLVRPFILVPRNSGNCVATHGHELIGAMPFITLNCPSTETDLTSISLRLNNGLGDPSVPVLQLMKKSSFR
nr:hypothetical protein Iba_chr11aCG18460 [Ipomoea batatas]